MLKKGVAFPIQMNKRNDLAQTDGEELEIVNLTLLLGIKRGECDWDGDLGTRFELLRHKKMPTLVQKAIAVREATDQINQYAKDYIVTNGATEANGNSAKVSIEVAPRANLEDRKLIEVEA